VYSEGAGSRSREWVGGKLQVENDGLEGGIGAEGGELLVLWSRAASLKPLATASRIIANASSLVSSAPRPELFRVSFVGHLPTSRAFNAKTVASS